MSYSVLLDVCLLAQRSACVQVEILQRDNELSRHEFYVSIVYQLKKVILAVYKQFPIFDILQC